MISDKYIANFKPSNVVTTSRMEVEPLSYVKVDFNDVFKPAYNDLGKLLLTAAKSSDSAAVEGLLSRGAPFSTDWLGTSPLHFAAKNDDIDTCRILLDNGISKDAKTKVERTPLHLAAYEGHLNIVQLLLANKCDIDAKDMLKMTPLHWAVENRHTDIVEELLEHGANPNVCCKFDKTPLSIARQMGDAHLCKIILDAQQKYRVNDKQIEEATESLLFELQQQKDRETQRNNLVIDEETNFSNSENVTIDVDADDTIIEDSDSSSQIEKDDTFSLSDALIQFNASTNNNNMEKSLQILRDHGISMSEEEPEHNLITSAIQSGRKIVLSEAGKLLFNNDKSLQNSQPLTQTNKQVIPQRQMLPQPQKVNTIQTLSPGKKNKFIKILSPSQFKQIYGNDGINKISHDYLKSVNGDTNKRKQSPICITPNAQSKKIMVSNNVRSDLTTTTNKTTSNVHLKNLINSDQIKKSEYVNKLPHLPQGTILTIANDGSVKQSVNTTRIPEITPNKYKDTPRTQTNSLSIVEIEKQLLELRKENEQLRKQFELSQKQSEGYRKRLEKLEKDNEMFKNNRFNIMQGEDFDQ